MNISKYEKWNTKQMMQINEKLLQLISYLSNDNNYLIVKKIEMKFFVI